LRSTFTTKWMRLLFGASEHVEAGPLRLAELGDGARPLGLDHHLARLALGVGQDRLLARVGAGRNATSGLPTSTLRGG
jgi:hypothetical protein